MTSSSSLLFLLSYFAGWGWFGSVSGSPAVAEAFGAVLTVVSPGQTILSGDSLHSLFNTLEKRVQCDEVSCEKCNLAEGVHQLISNHSMHEEEERGKGSQREEEEEEITVGVSEFPAVAAGCVLYLTSPGLVCMAITEGRWGEETEHFLHKITHEEHHDEHQEESEPHEDDEHNHEEQHIDVHGLEALLQKLDGHYEPSPTESCVSPTDIMAEVSATSAGQEQEVGAVLGYILFHALQGHCFISHSLPEESFFLEYVMGRMGSENFTISDLKTLMRSLNLGPNLGEHDHEHEGEHEDEHGDEHGYEHGPEHGDDDSHQDQSSGRRRKRMISHVHEQHKGNNSWGQRCFSAQELIRIHGLTGNNSAASGMSRFDLARISPALVQQILSGACTATTATVHPSDLSKAEKYIYATIANTIITLMSMFGIAVLLCTSCTNVFQLCIQFCISLAVGSLTGDALLHLLPMFLGLHVHESGHDHSDSQHKEDNLDYLHKMLVVIAGIYIFYLMETIFSLVTQKSGHQHSHHHGEESEPRHCDHGRVLEMLQQERIQKEQTQSVSKADLVGLEEDENSAPQLNERTKEQRMLPYMITIGDGIHNFADGLAIGAAFSLSWKSGLATSVAVFCHELPHELGDFAILLHSGLSVRKALLLNVGSAMTSYIGLYIALSVASDLTTKQWIAAITAGLFLYVGLADMMPTMVHISHRRPWLMFLLQNIGLLGGWAILLVLALYEDRIIF
ncbi:hypothetical protein LDENG_00189060 [Lucifuga dentata]|nr:hypothetical protein LDENG_00189060 [Lucifuga dentata]